MGLGGRGLSLQGCGCPRCPRWLAPLCVSRSTTNIRKSRLRAAGLGDDQIGRLKAPIGLDLGGKAPFEIAVAVVAEAIAQGRRSAGAS